MKLSKEDASDLKSFHERAVECALTLQKAQFAKDQADRNLESFMHGLQYPAKS